jgi:chromate transporter
MQGNSEFLKDVLICSLGAYGGPEAHYGVFTDQLVTKKSYVSEEELIELIALCSILPGPTSTQTIVSIGYKTGGPLLAFLTMLVWALPVLLTMTTLSFLYKFLDLADISYDALRYIGPMAVGFIVLAAYRIGKKVVVDRLTLILLLFGAITTYLIKSVWVFPTVLIIGGLTAILTSTEKNLWNHIKLSPPWKYLIAFTFFAAFGVAGAAIWDEKIIQLFDSFYRYGYLVFGGGQVVVPVMHSELVELNGYLSNAQFLTGYGLVQGLPGPMFSFSAYAGGLAAQDHSTFYQIISALISGIAIFLPGLLLIYFVFPVWENLKKIKGIKVSLKGINAVAGGLISVSAILLMQKSGFTVENIVVTLMTIVLLYTKKIPAPIVVLLVLVAGFIFP